MSIVSSIYKAPIKAVIVGPISGHTAVKIQYNGKIYMGSSYCSANDKDFMSKKVGMRIAESRARSNILKNIHREEIRAWKIKRGFFKEYENRMDSKSRNLMKNNLIRQEAQIKKLRWAIHEENKKLDIYLKSQDDFIRRVRKMRDKDKNR